MTTSYDILIAGAGPAGLTAAKTISEQAPNLNILLVEKSSNYCEVVKCGEGVWKKPFEELITPKPQWIRLDITKASFHSPNNTEVIFSDNGKTLGYILDRVKFQEDLLKELSQKVTVLRETTVSSAHSDSEKQKITLSNGEEITAGVVIDASGPSSRLGESYGIKRVSTDLEPALYAIVKGVKQRTDTVHLQMSSEYSPGGYVWLFPVSEDVVNIGIVMGKGLTKSHSIKDSLKKYIEEFLPGGEIESWHGGAIPSFAERKKLAVPGFIQCGDAGSLVNPITRSGISESMYSGMCAAESAIAMLTKDPQKEAEEYEKRIFNDYSKKIGKVAKLKKSLYAISDSEYNAAAEKLGKLPPEKITMLKILQTTITKSPKLLLAMRHLL